MKMSRRERRIFNEGKEAGYKDGYIKGLHDGNPFILAIEAIADVVNQIKSDPELLKAVLEAKADEIGDELIIEDSEGGTK
jgi:flagellar biosynthesis/type III secretory pathway protein FliH